MSALGGFAHAFQRLGRGALEGAIGGAVCGAALGIIGEMVKNDGSARQSALPIDAPHLQKNAEMLSRVQEVLAGVPATMQGHGIELVRHADIVCRVEQASDAGQAGRTAAALAIRSLRRLESVAKTLLQTLPGAGLREPLEELVQGCDDVVHNLCLE